ncbi:MAG: hypothetical protein J6T24_05915, partial [Clostridia bacterium]|nr:hypothetical protein [Clostridia bacterium]
MNPRDNPIQLHKRNPDDDDHRGFCVIGTVIGMIERKGKKSATHRAFAPFGGLLSHRPRKYQWSQFSAENIE